MYFTIVDASTFLILNREDIFRLSQGAGCVTISPDDQACFVKVLMPEQDASLLIDQIKYPEGHEEKAIDLVVRMTPLETMSLLSGEIISIPNDVIPRLHVCFEELFNQFVKKEGIDVKVVHPAPSQRLN